MYILRWFILLNIYMTFEQEDELIVCVLWSYDGDVENIFRKSV